MASGSWLASVATTTLPLPARRATSRRISAWPFFSSWPPMMTRLPLAVTGCPPARRAGRVSGLGGTPRWPRRLRRPLSFRPRPFRPLVLLAIQLDSPFTVLEEVFLRLKLPVGNHALAPGDDVPDLERLGIEHQKVTVLVRLQAALGLELKDSGGVRGEVRKDLLQSEPVLQDAGAE